jgi:hypothetical protein
MSAQRNQVQQQQQPQPPMWTNSIFIPKIDFSVTKNQLKDIMEHSVGKVSRIDFAAFNSEHGSGRRVFIHFAQWYNNDYAKTVRYNIEKTGHFDMKLPINGETVRLLINKNPVPETEQTIQQVASNVDFMAEKIRLQEEEILGLKQTCENLIFYTKQMQLRMNTFLLAHHKPYVVEEEDTMGEMTLSELQV